MADLLRRIIEAHGGEELRLYFCGYATWNYLTVPFTFVLPGFAFRVLPPVVGDRAGTTRLHATFPDDIPAHSREQVFHFDQEGLLRRTGDHSRALGWNPGGASAPSRWIAPRGKVMGVPNFWYAFL